MPASRPKRSVEVTAAIAGSLEHRDLGLAARKQNTHRIDDTNTADEQREQTSNL